MLVYEVPSVIVTGIHRLNRVFDRSYCKYNYLTILYQEKVMLECIKKGDFIIAFNQTSNSASCVAMPYLTSGSLFSDAACRVVNSYEQIE